VRVVAILRHIRTLAYTVGYCGFPVSLAAQVDRGRYCSADPSISRPRRVVVLRAAAITSEVSRWAALLRPSPEGAISLSHGSGSIAFAPSYAGCDPAKANRESKVPNGGLLCP